VVPASLNISIEYMKPEQSCRTATSITLHLVRIVPEHCSSELALKENKSIAGKLVYLASADARNC